jgi:hypothetical protein
MLTEHHVLSADTRTFHSTGHDLSYYRNAFQSLKEQPTLNGSSSTCTADKVFKDSLQNIYLNSLKYLLSSQPRRRIETLDFLMDVVLFAKKNLVTCAVIQEKDIVRCCQAFLKDPTALVRQVSSVYSVP